MSETEEEGLLEDLTGELREFGLTQYEARTLIALLRLQEATAKDIARIAEVPRTRVYDAVENLHEMGFVDVQYASPQKFTVVSRDAIITQLRHSYENTIDNVEEMIGQLERPKSREEEFGAWTIKGRDAVAQRVTDLLEEAESEIVYLTLDDLFTKQQLDALGDAADDGCDIYFGGVSEFIRDRVGETFPSVVTFDPPWDWSDSLAGTLLIVDGQTALVSVRIPNRDDHDFEEVAIWGTGRRNSLVVVLNTILSWQVGTVEAESNQD